MNLKRTLSFIFCLLFFASIAEAARLPKSKTAEHVINSYFDKYGHKYKTSDFGQHEVENVRVLGIREIHKHLVAATAEVKLHEGPIYTVRCVLEKKTLRWKLLSWEKM